MTQAPETGPASGNRATRWQTHWKTLRETAYLARSQSRNPDLWEAFYERVARTWEHLSGMPGSSARILACHLADLNVIWPGSRVVELGCGTGTLALALAAKVCRVTALDRSPGMIRILEEKILASGITGIRPLTSDWLDLEPEPEPSHDIAVAAFFPPAFTPEGLLRMEGLARRTCLLVIGSGKETFPVRRSIWEKVMDVPCQPPGHHLAFATSFLEQNGRAPETERLSCPVSTRLSPASAVSYFRAYFNMFGRTGPALDRAIREALAPHLRQGEIRLEGRSHFTLVRWSVPAGPPKSAVPPEPGRGPEAAGQ